MAGRRNQTQEDNMNLKLHFRYTSIMFLFIALAFLSMACGGGGDIDEEPQVDRPAADEQTNDREQVETDEPEPAAAEEQDPAGDSGEDAPIDDKNRTPISGALRNFAAVDAVRVTVTTENLDTGETSVTLAEFVQPDSFHMVDDTLDVFIVGGKSYGKDEGGSWEETFDMSFVVGPLVNNLIDPFTVEAGLAMATFSAPDGEPMSLGELSFNGIATVGYEYTIELQGLDPEDAVIYRIWIGVDDELAYRQEIVHPIKRTRSVLEYEYDGVQIVAPGS
jgi:hypothetical protein